MKKYTYAFLGTAALTLAFYAYSNQTCPIWVTNDTPDQVLLVSKDGKEATTVPKNKRKKFGSTQKLTHFHVLRKGKGQRTFNGLCTLKQQKNCPVGKRIELKMSSIERMDFDKSLIAKEDDQEGETEAAKTDKPQS